MKNFERTSVDEFDDISSIDQYQRSIQEGYTARQALQYVNMRSRDNARTPFPWNREQYGGFSTVKPWIGMTEEYPKVNAEAQIGKEGSVFEFYKQMIQFRQKGRYSRCFVYGGIEPTDSGDHVIAYKRYIENEEIYCWFHFGDTITEEILMEGQWEAIWQSYGNAEFDQSCLKLHPYQSVMLRRVL